MPIKTIIFDFFGVICSRVAPVWFQKYFPEKEAAELKKLYFEPVDSGKISEDKFLEILSKLSGKSTDEVNGELYSLVKIDDDIVKLIKSLGQDYKIGLCSNSAGKFLHTILETYKLVDLFDVVVISSEYGITKPGPRIYKFTLEQLQASPQETIFIDDNPEHVRGAEKIGIKGVLFTDPKKLFADLSKLIKIP
ncbi:MAG: HAD family phosphatase [bacterium]|nr:HAD family phosphatase [bacterium]